MRRLIYILPVAAFAALAAYFFVALSQDPSVLPSAMIDQPVPTFTLAGLSNQPGLAKDEFAGQVVLINFFASWCVPCRVEHPLLMNVSRELGVPLYGIDYKDKPEDAARFLGELGDPYGRIGADRDGRVGIDFGVYGVPETYVIDKAGRIRLRHVGPLTPADVAKEIAPLVRALKKS
jgi:cytochrome c biogenesis protein CcmG, thiol:disulfide interchange protein DsbE